MTSFGQCYHEPLTNRTVSATEFKAKCLALLDEVEHQGGTITVTKRGRPVATVGPAPKRPFKSSKGILKGKIQVTEELLNAGLSHMSDLWEVTRRK
jgi:prevent-host-death family protein